MPIATPPIFALHGMLGTPATFDVLGDRQRYAPWLPGHGPDPDLTTATFEEISDRWVLELEERYGQDPVDVVGYSMGGRFALALCARHPDRFRRAVLVSAHPGFAENDVASRTSRRAEDRADADFVEREGLDAFVTAWEQRPIFASQAQVQEMRVIAQRLARTSHRPEGIAYALRQFGLAEMPSCAPAIARMASRFAYVTGSEDARFVRMAGRLAAAFPALTVEILPGIGHNPWLEAPALMMSRLESLLSKEP